MRYRENASLTRIHTFLRFVRGARGVQRLEWRGGTGLVTQLVRAALARPDIPDVALRFSMFVPEVDCANWYVRASVCGCTCVCTFAFERVSAGTISNDVSHAAKLLRLMGMRYREIAF